MRFNTLQQWLDWQETLNPKTIDLGLDRVTRVLQSLQLSPDFSCPVMTVAGTNGKGSVVAMLESLLRAGGYRCGSYTSPHLLRYNERIRIDGQPVSDDELCRAFEQVDQARGEIALTYFEFGTLAALWLFAQTQLDGVILEVGLGGRLDAVNVINPDVAVITGIGLDHTDWLGNDIESIAREKAGVLRERRPAVFAALPMPKAIGQQADALQVPLQRLGQEYLYQAINADTWQLRGEGFYFADLPTPSLKGGIQLQNAAAAIVALQQLADPLPLDEAAIRNGLTRAFVPARYQVLRQQPQLIIDVAHNPQAAEQLLQALADQPVPGTTRVVIAMLSDKAIREFVSILSPAVDAWLVAGLDLPRGESARAMAAAVKQVAVDDKIWVRDSVAEALALALDQSSPDDRILVCGSFYTVTQTLEALRIDPWIVEIG